MFNDKFEAMIEKKYLVQVAGLMDLIGKQEMVIKIVRDKKVLGFHAEPQYLLRGVQKATFDNRYLGGMNIDEVEKTVNDYILDNQPLEEIEYNQLYSKYQ